MRRAMVTFRDPRFTIHCPGCRDDSGTYHRLRCAALHHARCSATVVEVG